MAGRLRGRVWQSEYRPRRCARLHPLEARYPCRDRGEHMNSRAKGKAGELELAALLRAHGFAARRGVQYQGGADSPDVIGLPGCHIEVKRKESGNPYGWLEQAVKEAADGSTPVV